MQEWLGLAGGTEVSQGGGQELTSPLEAKPRGFCLQGLGGSARAASVHVEDGRQVLRHWSTSEESSEATM